MGDSYRLERFVSAQDEDGAYERAIEEVRRGEKTSHWMWFVFPQIAGLGQSSMSRRFAISSLDEATAYLAHPILGPRLIACSEVVCETESRSVTQIFGDIDSQKLRSSMTLFGRAAPGEPVFWRVLERYFDGRPDPETDRLLEVPGPTRRSV